MSLISLTIWSCFFVLFFFRLSLDGIDLNTYIVEHKILVVIKISANVRVYQDFVNYVYQPCSQSLPIRELRDQASHSLMYCIRYF